MLNNEIINFSVFWLKGYFFKRNKQYLFGSKDQNQKTVLSSYTTENIQKRMSEKYKLKYVFNFGSIKVTKNCSSGQIIIRRGDKTLKSNHIKNIQQNQQIYLNEKLTFCTIMSKASNASKNATSLRMIQAGSKKKIIQKLQSKQVSIELKLSGVQSGNIKEDIEAKMAFDLAKITYQNIQQKYFYFQLKSAQAMIYCKLTPIFQTDQVVKNAASERQIEKQENQSNFKSSKHIVEEEKQSCTSKSNKSIFDNECSSSSALSATKPKSSKVIKWEDQQQSVVKQGLNEITNIQNSYKKVSGNGQRSMTKKSSLKPVSLKCINIPEQEFQEQQQKVVQKKPTKSSQKENNNQKECVNCKRLVEQLQQSRSKQMSLMQKIVVSELYVKSPSIPSLKNIEKEIFEHSNINHQGIFSASNLMSNSNEALQLKLQNQKLKKHYVQMHKQTMEMRKEKQSLIEKSNIYLNDSIKMKEKLMRIVNLIIQSDDSELLSEVTELLNGKQKYFNY